MPDTLHPPLSVIETWPKPNYVDPQTRGPALIYLCIILSSLGICVVSARLYSRIFMTKAPGFDDLLILVALGFGIALSVLVSIGNLHFFSGHHVWDIPLSKATGHRLNIWVTEWCYVVSTASVKISVLLFYRRLSVTFSKAFLIATWVGIIYNIAYLVCFCLALVLLCRPVSAYWLAFDRQWATTHNFSCSKESISLPLSGVFSVIGDFYSALLPMLLIMNLDLPKRQKFSLYALFAFAFLVVAAGIVRTILLNDVINKDYDFTWVLWEMWIWGMVELYVAILAASAPALKPFFRRFLIEPITSAVDSGRREDGTSKSSKLSSTGNCTGRSRGWSLYSSSKRESGIDDLERLGTRHGGDESNKIRKGSSVKEMDDSDFQTKHFQLRHDGEGKILPMQIWKTSEDSGGRVSVTALPEFANRDSANSTNLSNWPVPPKLTYNPPTFDADPLVRDQYLAQYQAQHQRPHHQQTHGHVRNFSQPRSTGESDESQPLSQAQTVTQTPRRHRSHGSVKAARMRAEASAPTSKSPTQTQQGHQARQLSNSSRPRPQNILYYASQGLSPPQPQPEFSGRVSRLDSPSDTEDEDRDDKRYDREKPPWNDIRTSSSAKSSNTSEETLHLPRMGSRDFHPEREQERGRNRVSGNRVGYAL